MSLEAPALDLVTDADDVDLLAAEHAADDPGAVVGEAVDAGLRHSSCGPEHAGGHVAVRWWSVKWKSAIPNLAPSPVCA